MIQLRHSQLQKNLRELELKVNKVFHRISDFDYAVNSDGEVYSLTTLRHLKQYNNISKAKLLTKNNKTSYKIVKLTKEKETFQFSIHHLVACYFFTSLSIIEFKNWLKNDKLTIDHIDNNKDNNNATNLQILSRSENVRKYHNDSYKNQVKLRNIENVDKIIMDLIKSYKDISNIEKLKDADNNIILKVIKK